MKWYSVKTHNPPSECELLIKMVNGGNYLGVFCCRTGWLLITGETVPFELATHFLIPDPVEKEYEPFDPDDYM